jgi:NADPH-dependent curcumin reductase CurA
MLIGKRTRLQGLNVLAYASRYPEAQHWLSTQSKAGRLRQRMHVLEDLGRAPEGLSMLFRGQNFGKLAVQVSPPAAS